MAVRETLELDISQALTDLNQIGKALEDIVSDFKSDFSDAIDSITSQTFQLDIEIDDAAISSSIEDTISSVDESLAVLADDALLSDSITDAIPDSETVDVSANTEGIEDEISSAIPDSETVDIDINVDTSEVDDALSGISDTAGGASDALGGVSEGIGNIGESIGSATPSIGGFASLFSGIPVAGAAIAGLGAVADTLFQSAVGAEGVMEAFNRTTGEFAANVQNVNVAGLNQDLGELATLLGSDDEAALQAAQKIFQLGTASGKTGEQAAEVANQLSALAANAVSLNPAIGQVGDVTTGLNNALARGGKPLAAFGISLTSAEINARALHDTGKETAKELTQFEKTTAGAALATEKLGDSLQKNITDGAQNPQIALQRLGETFNNALEEIGAPLVAPILDLLPQIIPVITTLAQAFGTVLEGLIPALIPVVEALADFAVEAGTTLTPILKEMGPLFARITDQVAGALFEAFIAIIPQLPALTEAGVELIKAFSDLVPVIVPLIPPLVKLVLLFQKFNFFVIVTAIRLVTESIKILTTFMSPLIENIGLFLSLLFSGKFEEIGAIFSGAAAAVGGFIGGIVEAVENFIGSVPEKLGAFANFIGTWIAETATSVKDKVLELGANFLSWIVEAITHIPFLLGQFAGFIFVFITEIAPQITDKVTAILGAFISWIFNAITEIPGKLQEFGSKVLDFVVGLAGSIAEKIAAAVPAMLSWIVDAISQIPFKLVAFGNLVIDFVADLPGKITSAIGNGATLLVGFGKDVLNGLLEGIKSAAGGLAGFFGGVKDQFVAGFKDAFGIRSPARAMIPIGEQIAAGIGVGISDGAADVVKQVDSLVADATTAAAVNPILAATVTPGAAPLAGVSASGASNTQPLVGSLTVQVTAAPGMTQAEAAALGEAAMDAAATRLTAIRAEVLRA